MTLTLTLKSLPKDKIFEIYQGKLSMHGGLRSPSAFLVSIVFWIKSIIELLLSYMGLLLFLHKFYCFNKIY